MPILKSGYLLIAAILLQILGNHTYAATAFKLHRPMAAAIAASNPLQAELALHSLATAVRQIDSNRGVEILRQTNHANHFNLITAWTGEAPFHAFAASVRARHFRQTIAPLLGSPYDERVYSRVH